PTLKDEFLSRHYSRRPRPRHAYAFGLIDQWARLASRAPGVAGFLTQTPGLARVAKAAAGVSQERRLPAFAPQTFQSWFAARRPRAGSRRALFWPDTFTNHFEPEVGVAAVEELEAAASTSTFRPATCAAAARSPCCATRSAPVSRSSAGSAS